MKGLGEPNEENKYKLYYFLWIIAVFIYIGWAWIGVKAQSKLLVSYYAWLGLFAIAFILFDNLTGKGKWEWLDTVTVERTPINPKWIFIGSVVLSVILGARILVSQSAFIPYPKFQIFDYAFPNALLSGAVGVIENLTFFSFLLPTIFVILNKRLDNYFISAFFSIFALSLLFMIYHIFVYGANQPAMLSTFVFAFLNGIFVVTLRTTMVSDALHFTNNVVAFMIQAGVSYVFF